MFICNVKVNGKLWFKIIMVLMGIIVLVIFALSLYRLFMAQEKIIITNDGMRHSDITEIMPNDYTNILKAVHENIDSYVGKKIKFSGYVYRVIDFSDNQFVLARDMIVDSQSYVVGFLSEYDKIHDFEDGTWVEITGKISKGKYHNQDIPIIKINSINRVEKPEDEFVPPPQNTYIPTSAIL